MNTARLTGPRKAAILLLTLGEDAAAEVLKHLDEDEVRAVTAQMKEFNDVTRADVERVVNEYYGRRDEGSALGVTVPETKTRYLNGLLSKALGEERAQEIVEGILSRPHASALEKLSWHSPRTIAQFIRGEHPQVIAVILATMDEDGLAEKVLKALPAPLQSDVVERIAGLKTISQEWINDIEETLADTMLPAAQDVLTRDSGTHRVAEVLISGPRAMERAIMHRIEEKNPELAERIRDQMLRFDDFIGFDNLSLQKILHRATMQDLALAMRIADEALLEHVLNNLSKHAGQTLLEEIENMGPTRISVVEAAQLRLISIAREMMEDGELNLLGKARNVVA